MMGIIHKLCVAVFIVSIHAQTESPDPTEDPPITRSLGRYHGRVSRYEIMRTNDMIIRNLRSQTRMEVKQEALIKKIDAYESLSVNLNSKLVKQEAELVLLNNKIVEQEQKYSAVQLDNIKLKAELDLLKTKLSHQIEKETRTHKWAREITAEIKEEVDSLDDGLKKVEGQLNDGLKMVEGQFNEINSEIENKTSAVATAIEESLDTLETKQKAKNAQLDSSLEKVVAWSEKPKIRFNARNEENVDYSSGSIMKFSVATINDGAGYSTLTGVFTAPTAGTYMFLTNLIRYNNNSQLGIYHNGVRVSWAQSYSGSSYYTHFGAQAMMKLKKGDQVYVKVDNGVIKGNYYSYKTNTFQGYLID